MFGHVGHRAARHQVGQDYPLIRATQHVRRFRHEVDAAEDDEVDVPLRSGELRELERVTANVGILYYLVALVVVTQYQKTLAQSGLRFGDAQIELFRSHLEIGDGDLLPLNVGDKLLLQRLYLQLPVRLTELRLLNLGNGDRRFPEAELPFDCSGPPYAG